MTLGTFCTHLKQDQQISVLFCKAWPELAREVLGQLGPRMNPNGFLSRGKGQAMFVQFMPRYIIFHNGKLQAFLPLPECVDLEVHFVSF